MKSVFKNNVSAFALDKRGFTGMTFALSIMPIMAMIATGVDYSRVLDAKASQQAILDSVALQLAPKVNSQTELQLAATASTLVAGMRGSLNIALLDQPNPPNTTIARGIESTTGLGKICVLATGTTPTTFLNILGISSLTTSTTSCAVAGGNFFEVALVLDNSGSMNNTGSGSTSKISSLRTAATSFATTMFALTPNNVKMSVVPFSDSVAVDPSTAAGYRTASWVDTTAQSSWHWKSPEFSGFSGLVTSRFDIYTKLKAAYSGWDWAGCFETQPYPQNVTDVAPSSGTPDSLYVPMLAPDEPDSGGTKTYSNNYLSDASTSCTALPGTRTSNDTDETSRQSRVCKYISPTKSTSSPTIYGPNYSCLSSPLMRMSSTLSTVTTKIAGLTANGATNIHEGFMWGWRTLSPLAPFADGQAYNSYVNDAKVRKVIVLMTDGFNTWASKSNNIDQSDYEGPGYFTTADGRLPVAKRGTLVSGGTGTGAPTSVGTTTASTNARAALDALTLEACANARTAGVEIYAIGFSVTGDAIDTQGQTMLSTCTGDSSKTFIATTATGLNAAFSSISSSLGKPRLVAN